MKFNSYIKNLNNRICTLLSIYQTSRLDIFLLDTDTSRDFWLGAYFSYYLSRQEHKQCLSQLSKMSFTILQHWLLRSKIYSVQIWKIKKIKPFPYHHAWMKIAKRLQMLIKILITFHTHFVFTICALPLEINQKSYER